MREHQKQIDGMSKAIMHAVDMNNNGTLSSDEFEEFRRFLIGHSNDLLPMEGYVAARESGKFEYFEDLAGTDEDDERDPQTVQKDRTAIANKVVASYLTELWLAGHVDDKTYLDTMREGGGGLPDDVEKAITDGTEDEGTHAVEVFMAKSFPEEDEASADDNAYAAFREANPLEEAEAPKDEPEDLEALRVAQ